MKKNQRFVLFSILISLLAHGLLLTGAYFVHLPNLGAVSTTPPLQERLFQVKTFEVSESAVTPSGKTETYTQKIRFEKPAEGIDQNLKEKLSEARQLAAPKDLTPTPPPKQLSLEDFAPRKLPRAEAVGEALKEKVEIAKKTTPAPAVIVQPVYAVSPKARVNENISLESQEDFWNQMPSMTPEKTHHPKNPVSRVSDSTALGVLTTGHAYRPEAGYETLDQYLGVKIHTYRDPQTGKGYYRISIYPYAEAKVLHVLPKEIVFLVDASLSIQQRRLYAFKEALKYALQNLNPNDLFNIHVFKNTTLSFAPQSLPAGPEEISSAMQFLDDLNPSQTTNIYKALHETLKRPALRQPSYAMLLSDGRPTDGEQSSTRLIAEITRFNNYQRPIFAFSGGGRVNHFMLDFLAYPNRGWSEYSSSILEMREQLQEFTDKIRNPVLTNVHYQLTPLNEDEIYPKRLTDIYQDTYFTIYGRFDKETRFSVRVTGDAGSTKKEFIFSGDLAQAPAGDSDIARFWAFNKIYYLISKMVLEGVTAAETKEIQDLISRFELQIPYQFRDIAKK